jgi:hypothetical protein
VSGQLHAPPIKSYLQLLCRLNTEGNLKRFSCGRGVGVVTLGRSQYSDYIDG